MKQICKLLSLVLILTLISACSGSKKAEGDVSKIGQAYHNTTAHYNGYYNADLLLKESTLNLETTHQDNYNQILEMYKMTAISDAKSEAGNIDEAIKKASIVVALHRVSKWTDDCYLLIGQSQYLKKDYESAEETFKYMTTEFDPTNIELKKKAAKSKAKKKKKKKKKKPSSKKKSSNKNSKTTKEDKEKKSSVKEAKKEKPKKEYDEEGGDEAESYALKHRPVHQDAIIWLARTYIERENYDEADILLTRLDNDPTLHKSLVAPKAAVQAYAYLKQKKFDDAVEPLEKAIALTKDKKEKARWAFILAQIHQMGNRNSDAYAAYQDVLKSRPNYDMEFRARLNMLTATDDIASEEIEKRLKKMVKDEKNTEFQDQVYFALADIALKANDSNKAINYLKKSLAHNKDNKVQKAESYLKLAQLYYAKEAFVDSKNYYDSTLTVLDKNDERYQLASDYALNLTEIANNLSIIHLQDSLLAIRDMSPKEQMALAKKIKKTREENKKKADATVKGGSKKPSVGRSKVASSSGRAGAQASTFWAYNSRNIQKNKRDFQRKWGDRVLEDDWRRSNKSGGEFAENTEESSEESGTRINEKELEEIFKDVPKTEAQLKAAHGKIGTAMLELGKLYREKIQNYDQSINTLDGLLKRYPKTKHKKDALYHAYLAYLDKGSKTMAAKYKDRILKEFPQSNYATILKNPNMLKEQNQAEAKLFSYYDKTYQIFQNGNYKQALADVQKAETLFGAKNNIKPKFALLGAMCVGNLDGKKAYIEALKTVVAKYPGTDEQERAKEMLRILGEGTAKPVLGGTGKEVGRPNLEGKKKVDYAKKDNGSHYVIAWLNGKKPKVTVAKNKVSDYNRKHHKLAKLKVSSMMLSKTTPLIVVRRFANYNKAGKYFDEISGSKSEFIGDQASEIVVITQENYKKLIKSKDVPGYIAYFKENYK